MSGSRSRRELSYEARARIADNLFVARRRAGYSQSHLAELARVSSGRIGSIENGGVLALLDTYVRLAGSLSLTLDDLLAGVTWTPGSLDFETEAGYLVEFEGPDAGSEV